MPTLTETLEALAADVRSVLTRLDAFLTTGKPGPDAGRTGSIAIDMDAKVIYGPKAATGEDPWGDGDAFSQGAQGLSAKDVVIAAGALPSGASDEDFADWLANAQVASVTPLVEDAEEAASAAAASATTAATAATTATDAKDDAEAAATTATGAASTATTAASTAVDAKDDAVAAKIAAEAARDAASAIAGGDFQPLDPDLTAIAGLAAAVGLIKKTGAGTAAVVPIGDATGASILDRAAADGRYARTVGGVAPDETGDVPFNAVSSVAGRSGDITVAALVLALGLTSDAAQTGMALADLRNTVQPLARGVADSFADGSGISSLGSFRNLDRTLTNIITASPMIPLMTGATTAGWTASADSEFAGTEAWRAFDRNTSTVYGPSATGLPRVLTIQAPGAAKVVSYALTASTTPTNTPSAWTFEGSDDGETWTVLDTRTGITWSSLQTRSFTVASPQYFSRHRLRVTAIAGGTLLQLPELALTGDGPTASAATAQSVTFTAGATPTDGVLTVLARRLGGAMAINTDLIGWISRNGGSDWAQVTLSPTVTVGAFTTYEGVVDLTGLPSGSAMRWMLAASAPVEISGVALQWA